MSSQANSELLIELDEYLRAGVHIGTRTGLKAVRPYIFRVRNDGLFVLDIRRTDERIRLAAKFLARFVPESIAVASVRTYGIYPVRMFAKVTGALPLTGRFIPGTFTNPMLSGRARYIEPEVVVLTDPNVDRQALSEASRMGIPTVSLVDTDNNVSNIDLIIPCNNKGRNSLALVYWLLAREMLRERGEDVSDFATRYPLTEFKAPRGRRTQKQKDII